MSRYGYLICSRCKTSIWLGKAVFDSKNCTEISYFHIGGPDDKPNSANLDLNRLIWKFFSNHASHNLKVVKEDEGDFDDFVEIGEDIPLKDYLDGFLG